MTYINSFIFFVAQNAPEINPEAIKVQTTANVGVGQYILLFIYFIICAGLIISILAQTTKSEGLSGTLGGSAQTIFKGKRGLDEKLSIITNYLAVGFLVLSMILSIFVFR